jgi:hypothetical protein
MSRAELELGWHNYVFSRWDASFSVSMGAEEADWRVHHVYRVAKNETGRAISRLDITIK